MVAWKMGQIVKPEMKKNRGLPFEYIRIINFEWVNEVK